MWIWIVLSAVAGVAVAMQALINSRLQVAVGSPFLAATISFTVGLISLLIVLPFQPGMTLRPQGFSHAPWWSFMGGALGAFFIVVSIHMVPRIGTAALLSAAVLGQLTFSLLADHFGFFGAHVHPVSTPRLLGTVLVIMGVVLVRMF